MDIYITILMGERSFRWTWDGVIPGANEAHVKMTLFLTSLIGISLEQELDWEM